MNGFARRHQATNEYRILWFFTKLKRLEASILQNNAGTLKEYIVIIKSFGWVDEK